MEKEPSEIYLRSWIYDLRCIKKEPSKKNYVKKNKFLKLTTFGNLIKLINEII